MNDLVKRRFMELKAGGLLPSPKGVALAVIELTSQPNTSFQDITRMVKADPAIAGRILRYANAAHGGSLRHIVSLGQAITFLGMSRVRQIVLGFSLIDGYRSGPCPAFDYLGYWKGALATGIAAQRLAQVARAPADESYTCGLLAGVGRLGFATAFPADYSEVLARGLSGADLNAEESRRFGLAHAQLSAEMLDAWGLPPVFTSAVRDHELPAASSLEPGSRAHTVCIALGLASRIGQLLSLDDAQRWQLLPAVFSAATALDMAEEEVRSLVKSVVADWQSWANDLKLPANIHPELSELLSETPVGLGEQIKSALATLPLRFVLLVNDAERSARLGNLLAGLGYQAVRVAAVAEFPVRAQDAPLDVAVVDTGDDGGSAIGQLRAMQAATGRVLHVVALVPDAAKSDVSRLLQGGADDYLLYGYTEAALQLRVLNAQHRVSIEAALHADQMLSAGAAREPAPRLPGWRQGLDLAAREWDGATRDGTSLACLVLVFDHIGRLQELHGQDAGNDALLQIATVVMRCCRSSDVVFRHGENELCIVCPGATKPRAEQLAERIEAAVRAHEFILPSGTLRIAARIGTAVRSPEMAVPEALIAEAIRALRKG